MGSWINETSSVGFNNFIVVVQIACCRMSDATIEKFASRHTRRVSGLIDGHVLARERRPLVTGRINAIGIFWVVIGGNFNALSSIGQVACNTG
jgi:hypothetical protein